VVIIIKENHTYDNYFDTFPHSEGDNQLGTAQNPPPGDADHRRETWIKRATEQRYRVQYSEAEIPCYFCSGAPIKLRFVFSAIAFSSSRRFRGRI
jgi:phospholipase C